MTAIEPLVQIKGEHYTRVSPGGIEVDMTEASGLLHYVATCRECGRLPMAGVPQSLVQAGREQQRHLAKHLEALALEIALAAR